MEPPVYMNDDDDSEEFLSLGHNRTKPTCKYNVLADNIKEEEKESVSYLEQMDKNISFLNLLYIGYLYDNVHTVIFS